MKVLGALLVLVLGGSAAWADPVTILAEDAAGPWGQANGTGCGNDLVVAAFQAAGVEVRLEAQPYARAKKQVLAGRAEACFGMSWTDELKGKVVFPKHPLYETKATFFARPEDAGRWKTAADLKGSEVGVVRGYEYPVEVMDLADGGAITLYENSNEEQNLRMLAERRLDLVIVMVDELKNEGFVADKVGGLARVTPVFSLGTQGTFVGFAADRPETPRLVAAFDQGMDLIEKNGTRNRILETWKARR
jgi:polar amino acid transport system substrate-binding protein